MSIVNLLSIIKQEKEYKKETPEYVELLTPLNPTLAQLVEHMIVAHVVVGSNPASRIKSNRNR